MAFGGVASFLAAGARPGQTRHNIAEITGLTLAANVGAADRAAADTGALSSNIGTIDALPANTLSLPADFGPGPDDWSQADVDALSVLLNESTVEVTKLSYSKALVANVGAAPAGSAIENANAEVLVHSLGGAVAGLTIRLVYEHSIVR